MHRQLAAALEYARPSGRTIEEFEQLVSFERKHGKRGYILKDDLDSSAQNFATLSWSFFFYEQFKDIKNSITSVMKYMII